MTSLQKAVKHEGNHEGHKGTPRKCTSCVFTFVRFVSLVVKPLCRGLKDELDDLLLPYTFDLSLFNLISDSEVREEIRRTGVVFYERRDDLYLKEL